MDYFLVLLTATTKFLKKNAGKEQRLFFGPLKVLFHH